MIEHSLQLSAKAQTLMLIELLEIGSDFLYSCERSLHRVQRGKIARFGYSLLDVHA